MSAEAGDCYVASERALATAVDNAMACLTELENDWVPRLDAIYDPSPPWYEPQLSPHTTMELARSYGRDSLRTPT